LGLWPDLLRSQPLQGRGTGRFDAGLRHQLSQTHLHLPQILLRGQGRDSSRPLFCLLVCLLQLHAKLLFPLLPRPPLLPLHRLELFSLLFQTGDEQQPLPPQILRFLQQGTGFLQLFFRFGNSSCFMITAAVLPQFQFLLRLDSCRCPDRLPPMHPDAAPDPDPGSPPAPCR